MFAGEIVDFQMRIVTQNQHSVVPRVYIISYDTFLCIYELDSIINMIIMLPTHHLRLSSPNIKVKIIYFFICLARVNCSKAIFSLSPMRKHSCLYFDLGFCRSTLNLQMLFNEHKALLITN